MSKKNKGSGRLKKGGFVFSTNPDFQPEDQDMELEETLSAEQQLLYLSLDRKQRKGKIVTLIEGYVGQAEDLNSLAKKLKTKCGVGGSAKDSVILLQGDQRKKIAEWLISQGFKIKMKGA